MNSPGLFIRKFIYVILLSLWGLGANAASITTQPVSITGCQYGTSGFAVVASGASAYQWEVNTGSGWANVSNGGVYSGATTANLVITSLTLGMNGYQYRCTVTGSPSVTSGAATLTVNSSPTISSPGGSVICGGAVGTVSASPSSGAWVDWYNAATAGVYLGSGSPLSLSPGSTTTYYGEAVYGGGGATTLATAYNAAGTHDGVMFDVLPTKDITVTDFDLSLMANLSGTYSVYYKVGGYAGSETNAGAWTLLADGVYKLSPATMNVPSAMGFNLSLPLKANQAYAFYITINSSLNWGLLTTNTVSAGALLASNSDLNIYTGVGKLYPFSTTYSYRSFNGTIHYSMTGCSSGSRVAATITVNDPPAFTANPPNRTICTGSNTTFTVTATDATSYQWQINSGSGWSNLSNGSGYSGATTATLTITGAGIGLSTNQYRCRATGSCAPIATSNAGTLTVNNNPYILLDPDPVTVCPGQNASFSISVLFGSSFQWQLSTNSGGSWSNISNGGVYSGATTTHLTITGVASNMNNYRYRCQANTGGCSADISGQATLTVRGLTTVNSNPPNRTICDGANTTFGITANNATGYQWHVNTGSGWANVTNGGVYSGATTATLTLTGATAAMDGYQYRCRATGLCSPPDTSNTGTLTITPAPAITVQPHDSTVCSGQVATFSVIATNATSYQWQANDGAGWGTLSNAGATSGTNTATLSFTGNLAYSGWQLRCVVSGCSPSVTSSAVTLTVPTPAITAQPPNRAICSGANTTFTVTATDATGYQWQENSGSGWSNLSNGGIYTGATTATLTLTGATTTVDGYQYRCRASGCSPVAVSNAGTLTITPAPAITANPQDATICSGQNASFSITATNATTYQWQENDGSGWSSLSNGGIYSGVTTTTLTLTAATTAVTGYKYRCRAIGCSPVAVSGAGTLTVTGLPAITVQPTNQDVCNGQNTNFTITATDATGYQWQKNSGSGWSNVSNGGGYSGATTATLTITNTSVSFNNIQYRCIASGCSSSATSNAATLAVTGFLTYTASISICLGSNVNLGAIAANATSYQWQLNSGSGWGNVADGGIYTGATTNTLHLSTTTSVMNGYLYRCTIYGNCGGPVIAGTCTLNVFLPPALTVPSNVSACSGGNTSIPATVVGTTNSYQWQVNSGSSWSNVSNGGIYSGAGTATLTLTGATAAIDGYQYRCIGTMSYCSSSGTSNVATFTINTAPAITAQPPNQSICSGSNTTFTVTATNATGYQWQENSGSGWGNLGNGGIYSGATTATLTLTGATTAVDGYQYRCIASGSCTPTAISNAGTLTITPAPAITAQPPNRTICSGQNTTFTVTATDATGYQWQVNSGSGWGNLSNGGIYTGATTATLTLSVATTAVDGYQYRCIASGCSPSATSNAGTLTVNAITITGQPQNSTICSGQNTSFTVTAPNATSYQWQIFVGSSWIILSNGAPVSGTTTSTLSLTGVGASYNGYQFRCVASGCGPSVTSNAGALTINPAPAITVQPSNSIIGAGGNTSFSVTASNATTYQWQEDSGGGFNNIANGGIYSGATTSTLTLTAAGAGLNTYQYRCVVSGCSPSATSNAATLTVNTAPAITSQPSNSAICNNTNTSFSVTASNATAYQWQVNSGSGWNNISNGGIYSGATTATLSLTGATTALDGNQYRCEVTGATTPNAVSNAGTLTITPAPVITVQPHDSTVCSGQVATFSVTATDATSYLWQTYLFGAWNDLVNTGGVSGANTATLSFTGSPTYSGWQFRCVVGGCSPSDTSSTVTITISAPAITAQPPNRSVCSGQNTTFTVTAANATGYQWQENSGSGWSNVSNGGIYTGATTATLTLTGATTAVGGYQYRCRASGCSPTATSNAGTLTVTPAQAITVQPHDSTVCSGQVATFAVTATAATSYLWQVDLGTGWINLGNGGSASGTNTATLSFMGNPVYNGWKFRCVVGGCLPSFSSAAATLFVPATAITAQPPNRTICTGSNTTFTVTATDATGYQWQVNSGSGWGNLGNGGIYTGATTATLALTGATTAVDGYQYRCVASGLCVPSVTSNAGTLTINTSPAITLQPSNSTIGAGSNTAFSVTATGTAVTYQWQENSGSGFSNVTNGGVYSGATTSTLTLTAAGAGLNTYQYRCVVSGTCSPSATSNTVTLTVNSAPAITSQPTNSTICNGSNTSFNVTASNATAYQWQANSGSGWNNISDGGIYSGATTATLSLTGATAAVNGYQYRCEITGATTPNAVSNTAILTINVAPSISAQPPNRTICNGSNTTFTVTTTDATGYQWQVNSGSGWGNLGNGGIYTGATTATLTLTGAITTVDGYQYRCVVSGCSPTATSNAGTLTINNLPAITAQPSNSTIGAGSNTNFSVTANNATGYQWQVNSGSGWSNVTNGGVYSGATTATLTLTAAGASMDANQYRCIVTGGCSPNVTSNAATLTVNSAPAITGQPSNSAICNNANTTFSVTANNATGYQWQVNSGSGWNNVANTGIYSGATTATLTLTAATTAVDGNQYRCEVTGLTTPNAISNVATLAINLAPAITTHPSNSIICNNSNTTFTIAATDATGYQWQVNSGSGWTNVSNGGIYTDATTSTLILTAATATVNGYQYRCVASGGCSPSVTSNAATITINAAPSVTAQPFNSIICDGANTSFSVTATGIGLGYQWQVNDGSGWANLSNSGIYTGVATSTLTLTAATTVVNSYQYRCVVNGACSPSATSNAATLTINVPPAVTIAPSNSIVCDGGNTSFTVTATGTGLSYQWQVNSGSGWGNVTNGGIYSGAATNTLALTVATAAQDGNQYRCVVNGSCTPSATSNGATLSINSILTINTQPANSIICAGNNTTFNVVASASGLGYQWQVNSGSGWNNVTNGGIYSGATTATLTLTTATTAVNAYQYRCELSSSCTAPTSSVAATLTVNVAPAITLQPSNSTICLGSNTSFAITASGSGITYQWEVNSGSGWANVSNGGIYTGSATNTLSLTSPTTAVNGYQYRCIVGGSCVPGIISSAVTLAVNTAPAITSQPSNSIICSGSSTSFAITATGTNISYQWQVNSGAGWANVNNGGIYTGATTNTLDLTTPTTSVTGYQYRCAVNGVCPPDVTSSVATITVNIAPAITAQPTNSTICLGSNTSFAITASGSGITYQWEVNNGSSWTNVANAGIYTGATTNTLNLTAPTTIVDGYQYRCIVGGACVPGVTSSAVTLAVNSAPAITSQPSNSIICSGSNTSFAITATGTSIGYQWQVNSGAGWANVNNGGIYTGATTNTLDLTAPATSVDGNQYRCLVNGVCPSNVTSSVATITVNVAPAITAQPTNSTICLGSNTSFAITASGSGITYQWEVNSGSGWSNVNNGGIYAGATTNTLNLTSPTTAVTTYQYRCIVGGVCVPGITSSAVILTVNSLPAITSQPSNSTICSGDNTSFYIAATGTNVTYQWEVNNGAGWVNVSNGVIYTGATASTLNLTVPTTLVGGYQYRCLVNGTCSPSVTSSAATITVNTAPTITTQPSNKVICDGSSASFAVIANGTGLTYQWQVDNGTGWNNVANTGIYSGATTATLNLSGASTAVNTYQYRCVIGGVCVPVITSSAVTLTVNSLPVVTAQPSNSTICSGDNTSFTIAATGTNITYQWEVNNGAGWVSISNSGIYSGATTDTLILTAATAQALYQYRCVVSGTCTPAATSSAAILTINTSPAITNQPVNKVICEGTNTSFTVAATGTGLTYQWQVNNGSGWSNVSNTGIYSGTTTNTLNLTNATTAVNAYQYRCAIGGVCAPGVTTVAVSLTINTIPVITSQPGSSTICSGNNTSYAVTATGTALSYQWQVNNGSGWNNVSNGGIYTGATASTLNLTAATTTVHGYQYRCVVSGTCAPPATSSAATISVNALPAITAQPSASTICENTNTSFSITATGAGITYQWQVNNGSSWSNVNNTGIYSGATTATLSLTGATTAVHTYQYRCVVSGTCPPAVTSVAVVLTIQTTPVITVQPVSAIKCEGLTHSFAVTATSTGLNYQWQVNNGAGWLNILNGGMYAGATTSTLGLTGIPSSYNNYQYRCVINGVCAPGTTSAIASLTVYTNPVVTVQPPASPVICNDDNISISLQATGTGLSYQWQVDAGLGWAFISNGGVYSGVSTNTLVLTNVPSGYNNYQYRCVITGTCAVINSAISLLTVHSKPAITLNPVNIAVCDGTNNVLFTMDATGTALIYQWQENSGTGWITLSNNSVYSGVNTKQLLISQAAFAMDGYQYRCVASGTCSPSAITTGAVLTVYPLKVPAITITPSSADICVGTSVTFTSAIVNGGSTPAYSWKVNGNPVGTGTSYTSTAVANNDVVICQLTSSYVCPTPQVVVSNSVNMQVTPYSTPAITVTSPTNGLGCEGLPVYFYSQIANGGNIPTYTWRINGNPVGANIDTFASILQHGDLITCILTSSLKCPLPPVVTSNSIQADILKITKSTIGIIASPDAIMCEDEQIIMYSSFTNGGTSPKYQWIVNGIDIPGETHATMYPTGLTDQDIITCRFISSARCVFPELSNNIVFAVDPSETPEVGVTVSHIGNKQVMFKALPKHGGANPSYQWYRNANVIPGATGSEYITADNEVYANISVRLISSLECVTSQVAMSRNITSGIELNAQMLSAINLYPNPNTGSFSIEAVCENTMSGTAELEIMNSIGQLVYKGKVNVTNGKIGCTIQLNNEPAASTYMLWIVTEGHRVPKMFTITR